MKLSSRKLEFTFDVLIESLSDVPRLQGSIQCKLRLLGAKRGGILLGRRLKEDPRKVITDPVKIENHQAQFNSNHSFVVQMSTDAKSVLRSQIMRVSVRFIDTNNSQKKLGFSDIDLAELSPGENSRKPLLTGYRNRSNRKERQDNSRIILRINMRLTRGDPMSFIPAGTEYNSYSGQRNVINDILNPTLGGGVGKTTVSGGGTGTGGGNNLETSTLHSQLNASEGGGHHSRNPSASIDFCSSLPSSQQPPPPPPFSSTSSALLSSDHRRRGLSSNSIHSMRPPSLDTSSMYSYRANDYNFSYNTTSIGTIANRNSAMANMEHSTLPANSNSAAYLFHLSDPNASSASNPNLTRGSLVSSTSSANQVSENQGATTGKRLGDVAEDSTDSLAPTRRNNRALVDSLFNDFTPLSPRME